jgi:transcription antitermination factor NusG
MEATGTKQSGWYVVYTCPNSEKKIYAELNKRAITAFMPTKKVVKQWSDRKQKIEVPLFPNYVFVKVPHNEMWTVLMISGVVRFVSFEGKPAVVKDAEIDFIKKLASAAGMIHNEDRYIEGEKVKVKEGPLLGMVGKVKNKKGVTRLYVEIDTVRQVVSIDIDAALLEIIE